VSPVKYEMCFYFPEDDILHSHSCENFKTYISRNVHVAMGEERIMGRGVRQERTASDVNAKGP
jgi:hypothetical protein